MRSFGMNSQIFENSVADVAKCLTRHGVRFTISLASSSFDAMENLGRELMELAKDQSPGVLPRCTVHFPTHLYNLQVLEPCKDLGCWLVTDKH